MFLVSITLYYSTASIIFIRGIKLWTDPPHTACKVQKNISQISGSCLKKYDVPVTFRIIWDSGTTQNISKIRLYSFHWVSWDSRLFSRSQLVLQFFGNFQNQIWIHFWICQGEPLVAWFGWRVWFSNTVPLLDDLVQLFFGNGYLSLMAGWW